ncbi:MAG: hypothetical protein PHV82_02515 [Victivallaceae bacterium]|nr:hypothetical protein [Victivallaceae bacterium]
MSYGITRALFASLLLLLLPSLLIQADGADSGGKEILKMKWDAAKIFKECNVSDVILSNLSITLKKGVLIENDSPGAAGVSGYGPASDVINSGCQVKKIFCLENPDAFCAKIIFFAIFRNIGEIEIKVNEHSFVYRFLKHDQKKWHYVRQNSNEAYTVGNAGVYYAAFPPEWLKKGENTVIFSLKEKSGNCLIGLSDYRNFDKGTSIKYRTWPLTSMKSFDQGKTWTGNLGQKSNVKGEYSIRLYLEQYCREGAVISPVIDLTGQDTAIKARADLSAVKLEWGKRTPAETGIRFFVRSGQIPLYSPDAWTEWAEYRAGQLLKPRGQYLQWKAVMASGNPRLTPSLKAVNIQSEGKLIKPSWADSVYIMEYENQHIERSSFNYEYENYKHPDLVKLRTAFQLDSVVKDAAGEFDKILKLMHWAYLVPFGAGISGKEKDFSWNPLDHALSEKTAGKRLMMNTYEQRRRDKICTASAVVLSNALLSFGIPARHVNIAGHEICEAWSKDFRKWVFLDATRDYYYYDGVTGVPLSVLDLHNVNAGKNDWRKQLLKNSGNCLENVAEQAQYPQQLFDVRIRQGDNKYRVEANIFLKNTDYFRILPRNNLLSQKYPIPLNHGRGMLPWPWNGYLNWTDESAPPLKHYSIFTCQARDLYPTLNQVEFSLEYGTKPGTVKVWLDTFTPNFTRFATDLDNSGWKTGKSEFTWDLHEGVNTLRACSENNAGSQGIVSKIVLNYVK